MTHGIISRRLLSQKSVHSPEVIILDEPTAKVDIEIELLYELYVKK